MTIIELPLIYLSGAKQEFGQGLAGQLLLGPSCSQIGLELGQWVVAPGRLGTGVGQHLPVCSYGLSLWSPRGDWLGLSHNVEGSRAAGHLAWSLQLLEPVT